MSKNIIITIDGPAGSGKSTTAKLLAQRLGYTYLDTGAMYRAVTYLALRQGAQNDLKKIIELTENSRIDLNSANGSTEVFLNGEDVTEKIRTFEVNNFVSEISRIAEVRHILVEKQREIGLNSSIVAEGRDTGTVVFPHADVKIFLVASLEERARRRQKELKTKGEEIELNEVEGNLSKRDHIDSSREVSPLTKASDAIEVDTSSVTINQQVDIIFDIVQRKVEQSLHES